MTTGDAEKGEIRYLYPYMLPANSGLLFAVVNLDTGTSQVLIQNPDTGESSVLLEEGSQAQYVPSGHLIYVLSGRLLAVPFDLERLEITGSPATVLDGVNSALMGGRHFGLSTMGSLAYIPGRSGREESTEGLLVWVDRQGETEPLKAPPRKCPSS